MTNILPSNAIEVPSDKDASTIPSALSVNPEGATRVAGTSAFNHLDIFLPPQNFKSGELDDLFANSLYFDGHKFSIPEIIDILTTAKMGFTFQQAAFYRHVFEKEPVIVAHMSTRINALLGIPWDIKADSDAPFECKAMAKELKKILKRAGLRKFMRNAMSSMIFGYDGHSIIWEPGGNGIKEFCHIDPGNIYYDIAGRSEVRGMTSIVRELITKETCHKYVFHDHMIIPGIPAVGGLMRIICFFWLFKHEIVKHMVRYIEKFGMPQTVAKLKEVDFNNSVTRGRIKDSLMRLGSDGVMLVNEDCKIEPFRAEQHGTNAEFESKVEYFDKVYALLILGQEGTSAKSSGLSEGGAQAAVRQDIMEADCENMIETVCSQILAPLVKFKYGPDFVDYFHFTMDYKPPADLGKLAATYQVVSAISKDIGYQLTADDLMEKFQVTLVPIAEAAGAPAAPPVPAPGPAGAGPAMPLPMPPPGGGIPPSPDLTGGLPAGPAMSPAPLGGGVPPVPFPQAPLPGPQGSPMPLSDAPQGVSSFIAFEEEYDYPPVAYENPADIRDSLGTQQDLGTLPAASSLTYVQQQPAGEYTGYTPPEAMRQQAQPEVLEEPEEFFPTAYLRRQAAQQPTPQIQIQGPSMFDMPTQMEMHNAVNIYNASRYPEALLYRSQAQGTPDMAMAALAQTMASNQQGADDEASQSYYGSGASDAKDMQDKSGDYAPHVNVTQEDFNKGIARFEKSLSFQASAINYNGGRPEIKDADQVKRDKFLDDRFNHELDLLSPDIRQYVSPEAIEKEKARFKQEVESRKGKSNADLEKTVPWGLSVSKEDLSMVKNNFAENMWEIFKRKDDEAAQNIFIGLGGLVKMFSGGLVEMPYQKTLLDANKYMEAVEAADAIKGGNFVSKALYTMSSMAPSLTIGLAVSGLTGPAGFFVTSGLEGMGSSYGMMKEQGMSDAIALPVSFGLGAVDGFLSTLQIGKIAPGATNAMKSLVIDETKKALGIAMKDAYAQAGKYVMPETMNKLLAQGYEASVKLGTPVQTWLNSGWLRSPTAIGMDKLAKIAVENKWPGVATLNENKIIPNIVKGLANFTFHTTDATLLGAYQAFTGTLVNAATAKINDIVEGTDISKDVHVAEQLKGNLNDMVESLPGMMGMMLAGHLASRPVNWAANIVESHRMQKQENIQNAHNDYMEKYFRDRATEAPNEVFRDDDTRNVIFQATALAAKNNVGLGELVDQGKLKFEFVNNPKEQADAWFEAGTISVNTNGILKLIEKINTAKDYNDLPELNHSPGPIPDNERMRLVTDYMTQKLEGLIVHEGFGHYLLKEVMKPNEINALQGLISRIDPKSYGWTPERESAYYTQFLKDFGMPKEAIGELPERLSSADSKERIAAQAQVAKWLDDNNKGGKRIGADQVRAKVEMIREEKAMLYLQQNFKSFKPSDPRWKYVDSMTAKIENIYADALERMVSFVNKDHKYNADELRHDAARRMLANAWGQWRSSVPGVPPPPGMDAATANKQYAISEQKTVPTGRTDEEVRFLNEQQAELKSNYSSLGWTANMRDLRDAIEASLGYRLPDGSLSEVRPEMGARVAKSVEAIGRAFGVEIVFYGQTGGPLLASHELSTNGLAIAARPGKVFIRADASMPHMQILGHELAHRIQYDKPSLYRELFKAISREVVNDKAWREWYDKTQGQVKANPEQWQHELVANYIGEKFLDNAFWDRVGKYNPNLFQAVGQMITDMLAKVKVAFAQIGLGNVSQKIVNDTNRLQDTAAHVFSKYAEFRKQIETLKAAGVPDTQAQTIAFRLGSSDLQEDYAMKNMLNEELAPYKLTVDQLVPPVARRYAIGEPPPIVQNAEATYGERETLDESTRKTQSAENMVRTLVGQLPIERQTIDLAEYYKGVNKERRDAFKQGKGVAAFAQAIADGYIEDNKLSPMRAIKLKDQVAKFIESNKSVSEDKFLDAFDKYWNDRKVALDAFADKKTMELSKVLFGDSKTNPTDIRFIQELATIGLGDPKYSKMWEGLKGIADEARTMPPEQAAAATKEILGVVGAKEADNIAKTFRKWLGKFKTTLAPYEAKYLVAHMKELTEGFDKIGSVKFFKRLDGAMDKAIEERDAKVLAAKREAAQELLSWAQNDLDATRKAAKGMDSEALIANREAMFDIASRHCATPADNVMLKVAPHLSGEQAVDLIANQVRLGRLDNTVAFMEKVANKSGFEGEELHKELSEALASTAPDALRAAIVKAFADRGVSDILAKKESVPAEGDSLSANALQAIKLKMQHLPELQKSIEELRNKVAAFNQDTQKLPVEAGFTITGDPRTREDLVAQLHSQERQANMLDPIAIDQLNADSLNYFILEMGAAKAGVKDMAALSRQEYHIMLNDDVAQMAQAMSGVGAGEPFKTGNVGEQRGSFEKLIDAGDKYLYHQLRTGELFGLLDGFKGVCKKIAFEPLIKAYSNLMASEDRMKTTMANIVKAVEATFPNSKFSTRSLRRDYLKDADNNYVTVNSKGDRITLDAAAKLWCLNKEPHQRQHVLLTGTEFDEKGNITKLLGDDNAAVLNKILGAFEKYDGGSYKHYADLVQDRLLAKDVWGLTNGAYRSLHGMNMDSIVGYFPIRHLLGGYADAPLIREAAMRGSSMRKYMSPGFVKTRRDTSLGFDLFGKGSMSFADDISGIISETARYSSLAQPMAKLYDILKHPTFEGEKLTQLRGPAGKRIWENLEDLHEYVMNPQRFESKFMSRMRNLTSISLLAFKPTVWFLQFTSLPMGLRDMNLLPMARNLFFKDARNENVGTLADAILHPDEFIYKHSQLLNQRHRNSLGTLESIQAHQFMREAFLDPTFANKMKALIPSQGAWGESVEGLTKTLMSPISFADQTCANICYMAHYNKAIHRGMSHDEAVREGENAVVQTQHLVDPIFSSAMFRAGKVGHFMRAFTLFLSPFSRLINTQFEDAYKIFQQAHGIKASDFNHILGREVSEEEIPHLPYNEKLKAMTGLALTMIGTPLLTAIIQHGTPMPSQYECAEAFLDCELNGLMGLGSWMLAPAAKYGVAAWRRYEGEGTQAEVTRAYQQMTKINIPQIEWIQDMVADTMKSVGGFDPDHSAAKRLVGAMTLGVGDLAMTYNKRLELAEKYHDPRYFLWSTSRLDESNNHPVSMCLTQKMPHLDELVAEFNHMHPDMTFVGKVPDLVWKAGPLSFMLNEEEHDTYSQLITKLFVSNPVVARLAQAKELSIADMNALENALKEARSKVKKAMIERGGVVQKHMNEIRRKGYYSYSPTDGQRTIDAASFIFPEVRKALANIHAPGWEPSQVGDLEAMTDIELGQRFQMLALADERALQSLPRDMQSLVVRAAELDEQKDRIDAELKQVKAQIAPEIAKGPVEVPQLNKTIMWNPPSQRLALNKQKMLAALMANFRISNQVAANVIAEGSNASQTNGFVKILDNSKKHAPPHSGGEFAPKLEEPGEVPKSIIKQATEEPKPGRAPGSSSLQQAEAQEEAAGAKADIQQEQQAIAAQQKEMMAPEPQPPPLNAPLLPPENAPINPFPSPAEQRKEELWD